MPGTPLEPIQETSDQSLEETKLVQFVKGKIDAVRQSNSRIAQESTTLTNVAYLKGFDGVLYDAVYRTFKNSDPRRKLSRSRFKVNKILPSCQNRLSRITSSPPKYDVRPNSNSAEDKDATRLGLQVLGDIYDRQRFNEKRQDLHMSAMQGAVAYLQATWDPTLGEPMIDPETQELVGYTGDVRIEVLNSLEVFPDPLAKTLEDAQYIVKAKVRKLEYFKEKYPERGSAVKEEQAWLLSSIYDLKQNALTNIGISGASIEDQMKNSAIEIVYYEKRCKEYPRGRTIVIANGVLLADKELAIGEYDIVKFDDIVVAGSFVGESVITHLRPVQDAYNLARGRMADWIRKTLAGKYIAAKGHGINQESFNNENGEVLEYEPVPNAPDGGRPVAVQIPAIPQYAYKELEVLDKEFDFIIGINEVSRGVLPSASIPAAGMEFLQEQDQTRIGVMSSRNETGYARFGQICLKYVAGNYKMPRLLKIAGDGLEYTVRNFVGADLRDNFDVIVIEGSTVPQSKVLKRQNILNDYKMGLLGNPADPKVAQKVNKMLEYGDENEIWKKQALTEARAKKVIECIEKEAWDEIPNLLSEFDNQSLHLDIMDDYRLTDKYLIFSDMQRSAFNWIMNWRLNALTSVAHPQIGQQQQQAEMMMQSASQNMEQGHGPGGEMADVEMALNEMNNQPPPGPAMLTGPQPMPA